VAASSLNNEYTRTSTRSKQHSAWETELPKLTGSGVEVKSIFSAGNISKPSEPYFTERLLQPGKDLGKIFPLRK
jgi:hypothetical protein